MKEATKHSNRKTKCDKVKYLEFKPEKSLAKYIQLVWISESEFPEDHFVKVKILPDGIVEIVFHYRDPFITYLANGENFIQPKGFAISQMRRFIEIESNGKTGFVSVRFYPWGAHHFFKEPIENFLDDTIDIKYLWKDSETILDRLKITDTPDEKANLIQTFLLGKLNDNKKELYKIDQAIKLIRKTKGQLSVEEVCEKTNLSYKQLEREFLTTVGATPKIFSRITRFLDLCHNLKDYENKNLTNLALDMGFYDQAHFIKEFKDFSGVTPKEYFEHNNIVFADL